jgi:uncharacterized protein
VRKRVVLDSNILISAAIYPQSVSASALLIAARFCDLFRSIETTAEIEQVLMRPKFERYFARGVAEREQFLSLYNEMAVLADVTETATECADPKDNKFLSLCLSVQADMLVSGDRKHLLPMHPYRDIAIVSEADFVEIMRVQVAP